MEVLDDYSFGFAEVMNKCKTIQKLMDRIVDPKIEHDIEVAIREVLRKHKVNLDDVMKSRYPELHGIYVYFDKDFNEYPGSAKLGKVEKLIEIIGKSLSDWEVRKLRIPDEACNHFFGGVHYTKVRDSERTIFIVNRISDILLGGHIRADMYVISRMLVAYQHDMNVDLGITFS